MVELPGIDDPARAKAIVQRSAFLEFRITDETNALEKAIPAMDRVLRGMGIKGDAAAGPALGGASSCWAATPRRRRAPTAPAKAARGGQGLGGGERQRGEGHASAPVAAASSPG